MRSNSHVLAPFVENGNRCDSTTESSTNTGQNVHLSNVTKQENNIADTSQDPTKRYILFQFVKTLNVLDTFYRYFPIPFYYIICTLELLLKEWSMVNDQREMY